MPGSEGLSLNNEFDASSFPSEELDSKGLSSDEVSLSDAHQRPATYSRAAAESPAQDAAPKIGG